MIVNEKSFTDTCDKLAQHDALIWDLETSGLNPYLGDQVVGVVLGPDLDSWQAYFPLRHTGDNLSPATHPHLWRLIATRKTLIGYNSTRFDAQFAAQESQECLERLVLSDQIEQVDGIILALLENENRKSFKLENVCKEFDPSAGYAEEILLEKLAALGYTNKDAKKHMWKLPPSEVALYACQDVALTRHLVQYLLPSVEGQGMADLWPEMMRYARLLTRLQRTGLHIDREKLIAQKKYTEREADRLLKFIQTSAGFAINPRSPKQLGQWLGLTSTNKAALQASGDSRAEMLLNYRKAHKAISTYHDPILARLDEESVIHPQLNLTRDPRDRGGTRSGRLSCSDPNFQALPDPERDPLNLYGVRACVTPRPGNVLIGADYDRMEAYIAGAYSGDPYVANAYHHNDDLYNEMAADLGIDRRAAKVAFLAIQYGIGPWKLGQQLGITETEAWYVREAWRERHAKIHEAMQADTERAEKEGKLRLWTDRVIHFDGEHTKPYAAWNRRIQSSCAEILRYAMQRLEQPLECLGAEMLLQVHDELWVEAPKEHAEEVCKIMKACMESFYEWTLRPRATPRVGTHGAELKG